MKITKHSESHLVELSDGSKWQIFPGDIDVTLNWQPDTDLELVRIEDEVSSVLKLRHGLQFLLGGVIHHVIGIPTATGGGCGGGRGGSYGTGGASLGAVRSGSSGRSIRRCGRC